MHGPFDFNLMKFDCTPMPSKVQTEVQAHQGMYHGPLKLTPTKYSSAIKGPERSPSTPRYISWSSKALTNQTVGPLKVQTEVPVDRGMYYSPHYVTLSM